MKKIFAAIPILCLTLTFCQASRASGVKISFTGDIIMHIPVKSCSRSHNHIDKKRKVSLNNNGFDFLFKRIQKSLSASDIVLGNMEFPLAPPYESKPKIFNCHPAILPALKKSGFTMMHIANNHILDQGPEGIRSTIRLLEKNGLDFIGVNKNRELSSSGIVKKLGDIKVGFIGYTGVLNYPRPRRQKGYYINWLYDYNKLKKDIESIRKKCDYLVMVVHTGDEYNLAPEQKDRKILEKSIHWGVDLVVGHHSHMIQPVEKISVPGGREGYIFYSLGNFISNQSSGIDINKKKGLHLSTRDSIIVTLRLMRKSDSIMNAFFEILPIRTVNSRSTGSGKRIIQTVSIPQEIEELKESKKRADDDKKNLINKKIIKLNQRMKSIKTILMNGSMSENIKFIEEL